MTVTDTAESLRREIKTLYDRRDLIEDCWKSDQDAVLALVQQNAADLLIEQHRDKATFYHESYLDLTIYIGKLTRKLSDLTKN